ncbi:hypothetical protein CKM354_001232000 [Cercospora kikuchii]|uniref:Fungal N-terminal domain-containing protein n=1 Tax=Cercospora kikuchii TaxID=84275 RepID=A0A9P3L1Q4_9PEZI|nr:uncharacterized protein CKM354_001232000 [Cercospora kikuchii]GIZ49288.1 hypothetical protein CKM354_001232000 [Cercospora kikuchii]
MAEMIGTAASVIQVAEAGFSLATTLYNYDKSVKSAEKDVKKVARDVKLTAKVLQRTHEQLTGDGNGKVCTPEAIHDLVDVLEGCKETFQEVDVALTKSMKTGVNGTITISKTEKMKWPLRSSKLDLLRANLEKLKTTLLLMLSVLAYGAKVTQVAAAADVRVDVELKLDKLQIESLVESKNSAELRYAELKKRFEDLEVQVVNGPNPSDSTIASRGIENTITAFAQPGADTLPTSPRNVSKPPFAGYHDVVATALHHCAETVGFLTASIDAAAENWRHKRRVDMFLIDNYLEDTVEATSRLRRKISELGAIKPEPRDQVSSRIPIVTSATHRSRREAPKHHSKRSDKKATMMLGTIIPEDRDPYFPPFDEESLQPPPPPPPQASGGPRFDWPPPPPPPPPPDSNYDDAFDPYQHQHQDSLEPLPVCEKPSQHAAYSERQSHRNGRTPTLEEDNSESERLGSDEEAATTEAEDPDPEDSVTHFLQRWTGLVGL